MLLSNEDGARAATSEEAKTLQDAGYDKCYKPDCNFFLSPEAQQDVDTHQDQGYYTCPKCKETYDRMSHLPWHGAPEEYAQPFVAGGGTRIGLSMKEQGQIGEDLVEDLHSIPGYGPIVWWHEGGICSSSPLDGATKDWGIEVKTLGFDDTHHRFVPGRVEEKESKNQSAGEMGLRGVLGVLVMLNFRTSMASIYVKEMPLGPWQNSQGRHLQGISTFRTNAAEKLLEQIPFKNPFMNPHHNAPELPTPKPEEEVPF